MQTRIDIRDWQRPVFIYGAKCLRWINEEYQKLGGASRSQVGGLLAGTAREALLLSLRLPWLSGMRVEPQPVRHILSDWSSHP